ncbi:MAG: hypothetical protein JXN59_14085 [Anaerolineae bacterium]|nr:hypothetical protein [Anaerolineae bacterium]
MNRNVQRRTRERGQATMEMLLMLPLIMGVLFLGLAIAVLWHAQALSAHLALEGASRDGIHPGQGAGFASQKQVQVAPSFAIGPSVQTFDAGVEGENAIFTMQGSAAVPWAPFQLDLSTWVKSSSIAPIWRFVP